jgi:serine/threonine protein kinase
MVGKVVAGRYHLVRLLGDGGMGAVYKAADQVLRRFVAIKLLHPAVAEKPSAVERFQREARAAAAIGHPNIIDVLDFGREGRRPYMVMEYLRGRSLSQVIAMDRQLDVQRAATIAIHTLAGLQAAHDRGILHRDLKPANLMLVVRFGDRSFVKVCDFGFAALLGEGRADAKALTPERTLVGTPAYAAPERLRGDARRDPRLDVYSVGVVLYEMLAGRRPFDAPTFRELARKVRKEEPPPLRRQRPDLPERLERVVMRALAKDREARWADAEAFAEALFPFGRLKVPFREEQPSDSFTMEMMRIKARETRHRETHAGPAPKRPRSARPDPDATQRMSAEDAREVMRQLDEAAAARPRAPAREDGHAAAPPPSVPPPPIGTSTRPPRDDPTEPLPRDGAFGGRLVLAILRFVARKFGERALKDVLDSMPPSAREPFVAGIDAESWVALPSVRSLIEQIDARLGEDDLHLALEAGRAAAEGAFELMRELRPPAPPPELLVREMPRVLRATARGVACEVRRVGPGYGRLELLERQEPSLTLAVATLGFLARSLERFGADDVEVNLLSARALDDPQTLIDLSWFA